MNVIDQAESLLSEKDAGTALKDALALLPGLLAECKQQQERAEKAEAEAARWQAAYENAITPNAVDIDGNPLHLSVSGAAALGCSPRAWLMTEERTKALERAARFIAWADHAGHLRGDVASNDAEIIRSMLAEAKQ